jgi:superfamily I DNA/RNA helicase
MKIKLTGNTYRVKEQLKQIGARWDNADRVWTIDESKLDCARAIIDGTPAQSSAPVSAPIGFKPSAEQELIFNWFKSGSGNLVVRARAGTGKTTTIKVAFSYAPEREMCYVVFNKRNQREAQEKITDGRVDVRTLHSLGFSYIKNIWRNAVADDTVERSRIEAVTSKDVPDFIAGQIGRLVGFAKNTTIDPTVEELMAIAAERGIDVDGDGIDDDDAFSSWTSHDLARAAKDVMELSKHRDGANRISYNDMVWLPVAMGWVKPRYDLVVVDEAQDMNLVQLTMARGACRPGGRLCVVGDDRQAIYAFRGAVQDGLQMMKEQLQAAELGLTITYRCPKAVVLMAAQLVPDYRAADSAPEGLVVTLPEHQIVADAKIGDAILSRTNAPLMPLCLSILRRGVAARIEGRDIGKTLLGIVRRLKAKSVPDFIRKTEKWGDKQRQRVGEVNKEEKLAAIRDQVDLLIAVSEGCSAVSEIEGRLASLFVDSGSREAKPAVVLSSVHKAKGLEWDKVWLLNKTFNRRRPANARPQTAAEIKEEANIRYVAITRAKSELVIAVEGGQPMASRN